METAAANQADFVIDVRGLVKRYGGRPVVDGLDLVVPRGAVVALLGPNGAGKSTTIEILQAFRRRDGGRVSVLGRDPARADRRWRTRLGIVPQASHEAPDLTVGEYLHHIASCYPQPRDAAELLAQVSLTSATGRRVRHLSGGQRRRLDIALAVVGRPRLLFLDEPTTGLDPIARRQAWGLLEGVRATGTSVLLTTHDLDEAARLADLVAVISRGRILATGSARELAARQRADAVVTWCRAGRQQRRRTRNPAQLIAAELGRLPDGEQLTDLAVRGPTLEDAYVALIESDAAAARMSEPDASLGATGTDGASR